MSFKVKLDLNSLKATEMITKKAINNVLSSKTAMEEMGEVMITQVQFETRRGNSIRLGTKFKSLSESWIEVRKRLASTAQAFSPRRSNVTASGQLLESLRSIFVSKGLVQVKHIGTHKPYTTTDGKKLGGQIDNDLLATYVQKNRPYLGVNDRAQKQIEKLLVAYIRRSARVLKLIK
jgi:hypothetical protein